MSCACSAARPPAGTTGVCAGEQSTRTPSAAQGGRGPQPRQASRQVPGPRARTASESSRAQGPLQRRARPPGEAHTHARTREDLSRAHASRWREEEGGAGRTQNKQAAAAPPRGPRLARARRGAAATWAAALPARRRRPGPALAGRRGVISGRAEGGDETGPRRQAWRCCSGGRGREGGCGRHGLGGSAPWALEAEGWTLAPGWQARQRH